MPRIFPAPPLPEAEPHRVRIEGSVPRARVRYPLEVRGRDEVEDAHRVPGEDLVYTECSGVGLVEGGTVDEQGYSGTVVHRQSCTRQTQDNTWNKQTGLKYNGDTKYYIFI